MTNLIKLLLPLFFLALIACTNSESSSSTASATTTAKEKKTIPIPPKAVAKKEDVLAKKETASKDETTITVVKNEDDKKQASKIKKPRATVQASSKTKKETAKTKIKEVEMPKAATSTPVSTTPTTETKAQEQKKQETKETIPQKEVKTQTPPKEEKKEFTHEAWDALLKAHVSSTGKVNYAGFKNKQAALDAYLESLKNNPPASTWSRNEKLAFWINAYNAFTVKLIVDNYPISSITKLHNGKPWDVKWINIGNKIYSLNNIENDLIRPTFKEPRIHFAVNCAAQSCPPLLNRAWTADNLNRNFEKQTKAFINNSKYNNVSSSEIQISKIFEWYGEDFGNIIDYLNKYANTKIEANATVKYKEYDWALNN